MQASIESHPEIQTEFEFEWRRQYEENPFINLKVDPLDTESRLKFYNIMIARAREVLFKLNALDSTPIVISLKFEIAKGFPLEVIISETADHE